MFERRRRVLSVARKMIAENGHSGFNVRDLCARAGIAQKTLYNAFGSKENVMAMAIRQYSADFASRATYTHDPLTLVGRLERIVKVHSRNVQIRPYTTALMAVFNSPTADKAVRGAIRGLSEDSTAPWANHLLQHRQFTAGVTVEHYTRMSITTSYAILTDWCLGEIPDDELVDWMSASYLITLIGMTRGAINRESRTWLQHLQTRTQPWIDLRHEAEVAQPGDVHPKTTS